EAQYNLAQIQFKKKDYTKARDRFEALFNNTPSPGGDKNQAAQIIKFKIYLRLLLEGKDSRAEKMMEQFQFTGDTPALYYAQAAWEFKHNNTAKGNDWIVSARKIYSPALNFVFADSFYDLGWLQSQSTSLAAASTETAKGEASPSIEQSPIAVASNKAAEQPKEIVTQKSLATGNAPEPSQAVIAKNEDDATAPASSQKVEASAASDRLPSETLATGPATSGAVAQQSSVNSPANKVAARVATASTKLAPPAVQARSQPIVREQINR